MIIRCKKIFIIFAIGGLVLLICSCKRELEQQEMSTRDNNTQSIINLETAMDPRESFQEAASKNYRYSGIVMNEKSGWCYKLVQEKDNSISFNEYYRFIGVNLRYRYDDNWKTTIWFEKAVPNGKAVYYRAERYRGILIFGEDSEASAADRKRIDAILANPWSDENQIYMIDPSQIPAETLDKDLFTNAINHVIPAAYSGKYANYPEYAMEVEAEYQDGYRFQVAFMIEQGDIAELWLDVLYRIGDGFRDYKQLSDLVDSGEVDAAQRGAFDLLQSVRKEVRDENSFIAAADSYKGKTVAGIDLSRLYTFLLAIEENRDEKYDKYSESPVWIREEVSREEYEAAWNNAHSEIRP